MGCLEETTWLCAACQRQWPTERLRCIVCDQLSPRGRTCLHCRPQTRLTGVISAGSYENKALRRGIHWLKFKGVRPVAKTLAYLLTPTLTTIAPLTVLQREAAFIPIPLHPHRLRQRGFNQTADIAQALTNYTGIPTSNALSRTRSTWTQTKLTTELRRSNMAGAFQLINPPPASVRYILLIDDVTTTGSTLSAAAAAFATQPGLQIWGCTIARG